MHWTQKYLSIHFEPHACVEFCEMVLNAEFGGVFDFPKHSGRYGEDIIRMNRYISKNLVETKNPKDGDIVLMDGTRKACHVGIFSRFNNRDYVLHGEIKTSCSCLHQIKDLPSFGYRLNKFLTWK